MVDRMREALEDAKSHLVGTNIELKKFVDKCRRDATFTGDEVILSTKKARSGGFVQSYIAIVLDPSNGQNPSL